MVICSYKNRNRLRYICVLRFYIRRRIPLKETLKTFLTGNDGSRILSPRFFEANAAQLCKAQQELSRKQKGSNHRTRARLNVARVHRHTKNRRLDRFCKTARQIVVDYADVCGRPGHGFDTTALGTKGIRHAYAEFLEILEYQMEQTGDPGSMSPDY